MNKEQRARASKDQIEHFFFTYYSHWRYSKILINEEVLKRKYELLRDIAIVVEQNDNKNPESTIAQELSNGLEFDSLANCLQYIEDLFALLNAGKQPDYFIRNIITYSAGQIENLIKQNFKDEELCKLFHVPVFKEIEIEEVQKAYKDGISKLHSHINKIKEFYKSYHFFYIQYKHGLTVALRPYQDFNEEQIKNDKAGEMNPYLVAFDNLAIAKVFGNKKRFQNFILMPNLTKNTQPFLQELQKEDNLTRYVVAPDLTIQKMKVCAVMVRECMHIFINNFRAALREDNPLVSQLPSDFGQVYSFEFPVEKQ